MDVTIEDLETNVTSEELSLTDTSQFDWNTLLETSGENIEPPTPAFDMELLPEEILERILSFLSPYKDMDTVKLVSKQWNRVMKYVVKHTRRNFHQQLTSCNINWTEIFQEASEIDARFSLSISDRFSHSAAFVDGSMYVFGGCSSTSTTFNDLWRLDLTTRQWIRPVAMGSYPSPKACATMVVYKGKLILFGGWSHPIPYPLHQSAHYFSELHEYDPPSNRWSVRVAYGMEPEPLGGHSASVAGDLMVVFGGSSRPGQGSDKVWVYNFLERVWYNPMIQGAFRAEARYGHFQCTLDDQHILVTGGCIGNSKVFNDFLLLTLHPTEPWFWTKLRVNHPELAAQQTWCHAACKVDNSVVVIAKSVKPREAKNESPSIMRVPVTTPRNVGPPRCRPMPQQQQHPFGIPQQHQPVGILQQQQPVGIVQQQQQPVGILQQQQPIGILQQQQQPVDIPQQQQQPIGMLQQQQPTVMPQQEQEISSQPTPAQGQSSNEEECEGMAVCMEKEAAQQTSSSSPLTLSSSSSSDNRNLLALQQRLHRDCMNLPDRANHHHNPQSAQDNDVADGHIERLQNRAQGQDARRNDVAKQRGQMQRRGTSNSDLNQPHAGQLNCHVGGHCRHTASMPSIRPNATANRQRQLEALSRQEELLRSKSRALAAARCKASAVGCPQAPSLCSSVEEAEPIPPIVMTKNRMDVHIVDISQVLTTQTVEWKAESLLQPPGAPTETICSSLVEGRGELILFGGVSREMSSPMLTNLAVNKLYFLHP